MKKIMVRIPRDDSCSNCENNRCVELYDVMNKPIHYTLLLDKIERNGKDKIDLSNSGVKYARCSCCGFKYGIDWTFDLKIPRPLFVEYIKELMMDIYFNKE